MLRKIKCLTFENQTREYNLCICASERQRSFQLYIYFLKQKKIGKLPDKNKFGTSEPSQRCLIKKKKENIFSYTTNFWYLAFIKTSSTQGTCQILKNIDFVLFTRRLQSCS